MACYPPPRRPTRSNVRVLPADDRLWRELAASIYEDVDARRARDAERRGRLARVALVAAVLMLVAGAALVLPTHHVLTPGPVLAQLPELDAGAEDVDGGAMADVNQEARVASRRKVPEKPQSNWARPPCASGYVELNGACWVQAANAPPCPQGLYEHGGRCYVPIAKGTPPPTSVDP